MQSLVALGASFRGLAFSGCIPPHPKVADHEDLEALFGRGSSLGALRSPAFLA